MHYYSVLDELLNAILFEFILWHTQFVFWLKIIFLFPDNKEVRYSVISGFIFLRFFAPAILGPKLFDLTTEQIVSM